MGRTSEPIPLKILKGPLVNQRHCRTADSAATGVRTRCAGAAAVVRRRSARRMGADRAGA